MADAVQRAESQILDANALDLAAAAEAGLSSAMVDRLTLNPKRITAMAESIRHVAALPDPVGETLRRWTRPNGLDIEKVRVPIGVIGIIFESRPNVTSDAAVLCAKTANATILRGGKESIHSNVAIAEALSIGLAAAGLPGDAIQLIPFTDREAVQVMCRMDTYVDCMIPRGGKSLIEAVVNAARMPVIKHYDGICILYVDRSARPEMAVAIAVNGKCQRPGVCNAIETLLIHQDAAPVILPLIGAEFAARGVAVRGDAASRALLSQVEGLAVTAVTDEDYRTEFLDLVIAVRVVDSLEQAIEHVESCGSHHSDVIVTEDRDVAERFLAEVDSATVYWNASSRFTDGGEFGFGAEIGISTDKLHARGPMALEELTSYKYILRGTGQVRS
jgi:glutamate-5-semialdehyde dehydrogenase